MGVQQGQRSQCCILTGSSAGWRSSQSKGTLVSLPYGKPQLLQHVYLGLRLAIHQHKSKWSCVGRSDLGRGGRIGPPRPGLPTPLSLLPPTSLYSLPGLPHPSAAQRRAYLLRHMLRLPLAQWDRTDLPTPPSERLQFALGHVCNSACWHSSHCTGARREKEQEQEGVLQARCCACPGPRWSSRWRCTFPPALQDTRTCVFLLTL